MFLKYFQTLLKCKWLYETYSVITSTETFKARVLSRQGWLGNTVDVEGAFRKLSGSPLGRFPEETPHQLVLT